MGVILNRIYPVWAVVFALAAHYGLKLGWTEAALTGAGTALLYYIAWELRANRMQNARYGAILHKFTKHQTGGRDLAHVDLDKV